MKRTGKSPGLTLRKNGGVVISTGSRRCATASAVCTSSAAPSMSRLRSNWMVIWVRPSARLRRHRRDAGDGRELPLDRAGDRGRHRLGAGAGQRRRHLDGRKVDPRQRRHRKQPIAENAEHDERGGDERRHHRAADADLGNVHVRIRPCRAYRHLGPVGQQKLAVGDHDVALLEPGFDHRHAIDRPLDLDRADGRRVVLHDEHERAGLAELQRRGRDGDAFLGAQASARC